MENDIYSMGLHETLTPTTKHGAIMILRVPGGWVYYNWVEESGTTASFVPFDNEFQKVPLPPVPLPEDI